MKQLKGIKEKLIENLRQRAAEVNIPEVVREMFEEGTIRQAGQWRARLGWRGIVDHANPMGAISAGKRFVEGCTQGAGFGLLRSEGRQVADSRVVGGGDVARVHAREDHPSRGPVRHGQETHWQEHGRCVGKEIL